MRTFAECQEQMKLVKIRRPFTFKKSCTFPKSNDTVPAGTTIELYISPVRPDRVYFQYGGPNAKTILFRRCSLYLQGFIKAPSESQLQKWDDLGMCRTPLGEATEPDSYDRYGVPSWLLVYGLI